jgi:hypothetical protein
MSPRKRWVAAASGSVMLVAIIGGCIAHHPASESRLVTRDRTTDIADRKGVRVASGSAAATTHVTSTTGEQAFARCQRDYQGALRLRIEALAASADTHDRLGGALLVQLQLDKSATDYRRSLDAIIEAVPDNILAVWLRAHACGSEQGCDANAAAQHLMQLEPANGAAWLPALDLAMRADDIIRAEFLLQQAARAKRFDLHWGETAQLARKAIGTPAPTRVCTAAAAAIGEALELGRPGTPDDLALASASNVPALPALHYFFALCPLHEAIPSSRLSACRQVLQRMADSDTLLAHMVGVRGLATHAATEGERTRWREELRNAEWMQSQGGPLLRAAHLPLAWEQGEVPVLIALLQESGRWPAPAGWTPDHP